MTSQFNVNNGYWLVVISESVKTVNISTLLNITISLKYSYFLSHINKKKA